MGKRIENNRTTNLWGMLRDIGVAAINKGQAPFFFATIVLIVMLARMPEGKVYEFAKDVLTAAEHHYLWGYILSVLIIIAWTITSSTTHRNHKREVTRMSGKRNEYQAQLGNKDYPSSEEKE